MLSHALLPSKHLRLYLNTFSFIQQLSRSESPSKVISSGKQANPNGEKDWEQASSPASLPEYTGLLFLGSASAFENNYN